MENHTAGKIKKVNNIYFGKSYLSRNEGFIEIFINEPKDIIFTNNSS